ncbi:hypothetical protein, partial [Aeromonas sp. HMWF015]|uniref:hypothetical protein n=1 Tax=Aeromonas sp. HMWF015 TaxID=2056851 RepID=UPI0015E82804
SQRQQLVVVPEMDKNVAVSVSEVNYPNAQRRVIATSPPELKVSISPERKGLILTWLGGASVKERYFEVSLVSGVSKRYQEGVTMLVVIPPSHFSMRHTLVGPRFTNNSNGYVVLMENAECGKSIGRSWLVGPGKSLFIPSLQHNSELLVGRGTKIERLTSCK